MDLSILKYCPHCKAPMTPTSYSICIGDDENCSCCNCILPDNLKFNVSECSVCAKPLTKQDFIDKNATCSHEQAFCLDCLKARRILQIDKEIYNCDYCGVELTQLDFLEDNAEIKRMLIVCNACKTKYFAADEKKISENIPEPQKSKKKKEDKPRKDSKTNSVSETVKSSLKALEIAVKVADDVSKPKIVDDASREISDATEQKTQKSEIAPKSLAHRLDRDSKKSNNMDYRAALGCLVILVLILSAGIAFLIYSKYSDNKNKATEDLAFILHAMREKQDELSDTVDRLGNRLYHLEQLEMQRSSDRINKAVDENDDNNIKAPDDNKKTEPTETSDDDSTTPIRLTAKMMKILEDLDSTVASVRMNAIMDTSWENFRGATPKLLEIVKNDENKWVRVFAIKVLAAFREKKLIPILKDIVFKEKTSIVTEEAQLALSELEKFAR